MTQPNQSELERMLIKLCWVTAPSNQDDVDKVLAYITANYTPNSEVEQLKSRIAWLEVEGLGGTVKRLPRFKP